MMIEARKYQVRKLELSQASERDCPIAVRMPVDEGHKSRFSEDTDSPDVSHNKRVFLQCSVEVFNQCGRVEMHGAQEFALHAIAEGRARQRASTKSGKVVPKMNRNQGPHVGDQHGI
jgi:hypothetical protein